MPGWFPGGGGGKGMGGFGIDRFINTKKHTPVYN